MTRSAPVRAPQRQFEDTDDKKSEAQVADDIASALNHLQYRFTDPEAFHVARDGLVRRLRRLSKRLGVAKTAKAQDLTVYRPAGAPEPRRLVKSRTVIVRRI